MVSLLKSFEASQEHFQHLLTDSRQVADAEQAIRGELLGMLDALAKQSEALDVLEEAAREGKLLLTYDVWPFVTLDNPDTPGVRQVLSGLPNASELLELLDLVMSTRQDVIARKEKIDEKILAAWRQKHPRFSSMGILDSDVQSENLKDLKPLARR